jgi:dipeptidase E
MRLLLISSTIVHGYGYLDYDIDHVLAHLGDRKRLAFIPFAQFDRDGATARMAERLAPHGIAVTQMREAGDLAAAEAIFTSGGNTFRLLKTLYDRNLIDVIRDRVRNGGVPYIGSSAGTNITAPTIKTTNDMPIVYPPSFDALGFVPFQINPHYLDPDPTSTHQGETREQRLREYLQENDTPVVGLREGSTLRVEDENVTLLGEKTARIFRKGAEPEEWSAGALPPLS